MAAPPPVPVAQDHQTLYRRLLESDPTAPNDLAEALLEPLMLWLSERHRHTHPDLIAQAADDALLNLFRKPSSYDPEKGSLEGYLRMSAEGDLRNLLARERRRRG